MPFWECMKVQPPSLLFEAALATPVTTIAPPAAPPPIRRGSCGWESNCPNWIGVPPQQERGGVSEPAPRRNVAKVQHPDRSSQRCGHPDTWSQRRAPRPESQ
eukprot:12766107-Alexandrium_andersonii.AAC.1